MRATGNPFSRRLPDGFPSVFFRQKKIRPTGFFVEGSSRLPLHSFLEPYKSTIGRALGGARYSPSARGLPALLLLGAACLHVVVLSPGLLSWLSQYDYYRAGSGWRQDHSLCPGVFGPLCSWELPVFALSVLASGMLSSGVRFRCYDGFRLLLLGPCGTSAPSLSFMGGCVHLTGSSLPA